MKQKKGFTTVELVIVIAVIAILATVLIPTFSGMIQKAHHSTDVQMASNLTMQIKMYLVENEIRTESDLRDAINENMGEGFYEGIGDKAGLTPESARYGYHFWYDIAQQEIVVATVSEIDAIIAQRNEQTNVSDKDILLSAAVTVPGTTWAESTAHFRHYEKDGHHFFLLDRGGSEIGKAFAQLDMLNGGTYKYIDVLNALDELAAKNGKDKDFADNATQKLRKTAIVAQGTYVNNGGEEIMNVYISLQVGELTDTNITVNNVEGLAVNMPSNVMKVNSYSLAFANAATLHIRATEEELAAMLSSESISANCTVNLPGAPGYRVEENYLVGGPNEVEILLSFSESSVVSDIVLSGSAITQNKIALVPNGDGYDLYVAVDYTNTVTLSVSEFLNAEGLNIVARGTRWTATGNVVCTDEKTGDIQITGYENDNTAFAGTVTAKIQNVTKIVNVYGVKAINVEVDISDNEGLNIRDVDQNNITITLPYKPAENNSFKFKPSVVLNYPNADIVLDGSITVNAGAMQFANNVLTLPANSFTDNASTALTVSYNGINSSITYTLKLINVTDQSFKVDSNVTTQTYDLSNYYVGKTGTFALDYLFDSVKNIDGQTITVTVSKSGTVIGTSTFSSLSGQLNLSSITETGDIVIEIGIGGATTPVTVYLVAATNITKDTAQADIPNGSAKDIVLLSDIELTSAKTFRNVYGNLHKIKASNYSGKTTIYWAALITLYGQMDNTVVVGPVYGGVDFYDSTLSPNVTKAWDGVKINQAGASIINSYIFGFRAPVSALASGTIDNTTIEGGSLANMHVGTTGTLVLNDTSLVQDYTGYGATVGSGTAYGLGVYFDNAAACTVKLTGNTQLYNWISTTEGDKLDDTVLYSVSVIITTIDVKTKDVIAEMINKGGSYLHSGYINTGFIEDQKSSKNTIDTTDTSYVGSKYTQSGTVTLQAKILGKLRDVKTVCGWSIPTCASNCTHTSANFLPEGWNHQSTNHSADYLEGRK